MTPPPLLLTAIILTRNEAANIADCIARLTFADEILVVDACSTDDTCVLAAQAGAKVLTMPWNGFGLQRRKAEADARHPWILMIDADERVSPALSTEIQRHFNSWSTTADAVSFPRRTWYMGVAMRWYRPFSADRIVRCYRRGAATWTDTRVHERLELSGRVVRATGLIEHYSYRSVTHHLQKAAHYIDLWAAQADARGASPKLLLLPFALPLYLCRDLILRCGVLDGWPGVVAATITAMSSALKRVRLAELQWRRSRL